MSGFISKEEKEGSALVVMPQRLKRFQDQIEQLKRQIDVFNEEKELFDEYIKKYEEEKDKPVEKERKKPKLYYQTSLMFQNLVD